MGFIERIKTMEKKKWCLLGAIVLCCITLLVGVALHKKSHHDNDSTEKGETQKAELSEENKKNEQQNNDSEEPETGSSLSSVTGWDEPSDSETTSVKEDPTKDDSNAKNPTQEENKETSVNIAGENNEEGWGTIR